MLQSRKIKFALELTINELSNIPHINGQCYVELNIRNHRRQGFPHLKGSKNLEDIPNEKTHTSTLPFLKLNGKQAGRSSGKTGLVSATSLSKKIHNFRCTFNMNVACNLKFPVKKEDLVGNKYLFITVYYIDDHRESLNHHTSVLGKVDINLTEYLNFEEAVNAKYLLKESKVNSILNLSIKLVELDDDYEFHTRLQVRDTSEDGTTRKNLSSLPTPVKDQRLQQHGSNYTVPQFEKRYVFGGIQDVIDSTNNGHGAAPSHNSTEDSETASRDRAKSLSSRSSPRGDDVSSSTRGQQSYFSDNMALPMVSDLYNKVLSNRWDPEVSQILSYAPERCVQRIFDRIDDREILQPSQEVDDEDVKRDVNGLISETDVREDLRSWNITVT